ncbi:MAG: type IV pilus assembly protein PilM, partial [Candidatus Margulisbacteria bacterium]|nr:type IV pilus assembly protein PilM [Candidatus Margulisiibacteriota bacterium]
MSKTRSILGIDLRINFVKVVEIETRKDGSFLTNLGVAEIPLSLLDKHPQKEDAQAGALRQIINEKGIKTREAAVVVGGSEALVRLFTMAAVSRDELAEAIRWKFAEEIKYPIEEALVDFYPLVDEADSKEKKHEYIAACVNRKVYQDIDYVIRKAGLKLTALSILPDALQKIFQPQIKKESGKIISLIYMGRRTTNISILKKGHLEFNRELNIGGENITMAMSGVLVSPDGQVEISPEQAEKIKVEHGVPLNVENYPQLSEIPIGQLQAMVRPALERIQDEIMRTFEYYKGQTGEAAIETIILTGGSSLTANLGKFLAESLGIPVVSPGTINGWKFDESLVDQKGLEKVIPRLVSALGAALIADSRINLIPDEIKYRSRILRQKIIRPEYLLFVLLLLLGLFYSFISYQINGLQQNSQGIQKKINDYKPRVAVLENMQKEASVQVRRSLTAKTLGGQKTNLPQIFKEMSRLIPRTVFVRTLDVKAGDLSISGVAFEEDETAELNLAKFIQILSKSAYFKDLTLIEANRDESYVEGAFNFELK